LAFDTLAESVFRQAVLPGEYSKYTRVQTGVTNETTEQNIITRAAMMRKWTGSRRSKMPRSYSQRVTLERYEDTLEIPRMTLSYRDQQGQVSGMISDFVAQQAAAYDIAVHALYTSNSGLGPTGFDAVGMFSASHPDGPAGALQSNTGTLPFNAQNLDVVMAQMMSLRAENGLSMRITPTHIRFGPKLAMQVSAVLQSTVRIASVNVSGTEVTSGVVAAAGIGNVFQGILQPIMDPNLVGTMDDWWEVLDLSKGNTRPMQLLIGRPITAINMVDMSSPKRFFEDKFVYGVEGDYVPAPEAWMLANRQIVA
jgi:phage major head subunit gpT-like protein